MEKPTIHVDLSGSQGNVFALMSEARGAIISAVRRLGIQTSKSSEERMKDLYHAKFTAEQMMREVMRAHSYDEALNIVRKYVNIEEKGGSL